MQLNIVNTNPAGTMTFKETKTRSLIKAIVWRLVAFLNSYLVLVLIFGIHGAFLPALVMNITGLIVFYIYERIWNKINKGKYQE